VTAALVACVAAASYLLMLRQREEMLSALRERAMPLLHNSQGLAEALAAGDPARVGRELSPWLRGQDLAFATAYAASGEPLWRRSATDGAVALGRREIERLERRAEPLCCIAQAAGAPVYVVSLPVRRGDRLVGAVRLGYPLEEVAFRERVAWHHATEVFLGVVVVGVLLSYLLRRAVLRPVRRLTREMRRVADGDLARHIEEAPADEMGAAARAFNEMTARLRAARAAIEGHNETLAATVARVRRELGETQAQLLQTERLAATGRLAAGVAHEINNPLTGILVLTQCLGEHCADPETLADLREIETGTRRCQQIVENLLAFAAGQPARCQAVDANRIVVQALAAVERQHATGGHSTSRACSGGSAPNRNESRVPDASPDESGWWEGEAPAEPSWEKVECPHLRVVRELAADLPPIVGDAAQLEQALRNVLMNAYQAMGEAGTLTVATKAVDSSVVISVADTGRGVDPEELGKVFDPFYTTRAVGEGVGLGLSVSYGIVRSHQGRLSLASRPGEGTTVTIELPCAARRRGAAGALAVL